MLRKSKLALIPQSSAIFLFWKINLCLRNRSMWIFAGFLASFLRVDIASWAYSIRDCVVSRLEIISDDWTFLLGLYLVNRGLTTFFGVFFDASNDYCNTGIPKASKSIDIFWRCWADRRPLVFVQWVVGRHWGNCGRVLWNFSPALAASSRMSFCRSVSFGLSIPGDKLRFWNVEIIFCIRFCRCAFFNFSALATSGCFASLFRNSSRGMTVTSADGEIQIAFRVLRSALSIKSSSPNTSPLPRIPISIYLFLPYIFAILVSLKLPFLIRNSSLALSPSL